MQVSQRFQVILSENNNTTLFIPHEFSRDDIRRTGNVPLRTIVGNVTQQQFDKLHSERRLCFLVKKTIAVADVFWGAQEMKRAPTCSYYSKEHKQEVFFDAEVKLLKEELYNKLTKDEHRLKLRSALPTTLPPGSYVEPVVVVLPPLPLMSSSTSSSTNADSVQMRTDVALRPCLELLDGNDSTFFIPYHFSVDVMQKTGIVPITSVSDLITKQEYDKLYSEKRLCFIADKLIGISDVMWDIKKMNRIPKCTYYDMKTGSQTPIIGIVRFLSEKAYIKIQNLISRVALRSGLRLTLNTPANSTAQLENTESDQREAHAYPTTRPRSLAIPPQPTAKTTKQE